MAAPTLLPVAPTMAVLATMCVSMAALVSRQRPTPQMLVIATTDIDIAASADFEPQYGLRLSH